MNAEELDLIRRALALRKLKKIGALWVESWRFWIAENDYDPASRVRISVEELKTLIEEAELTLRMPVQSEKSNGEFDSKISVYFKNKASA